MVWMERVRKRGIQEGSLTDKGNPSPAWSVERQDQGGCQRVWSVADAIRGQRGTSKPHPLSLPLSLTCTCTGSEENLLEEIILCVWFFFFESKPKPQFHQLESQITLTQPKAGRVHSSSQWFCLPVEISMVAGGRVQELGWAQGLLITVLALEFNLCYSKVNPSACSHEGCQLGLFSKDLKTQTQKELSALLCIFADFTT